MNILKPFMFWCQKVLPLVYDDSLSYYETLCKLTKKLNEVIENVNSIPDYIAGLISDDNLKELLRQLLNELEEQIASANEETSETATENRSVGDFVWLNGLLYRVIKQINAGDKYVIDSNVTKITVEEVINETRKNVAIYTEINEKNASTDITAGEWLWFNNNLCVAISDIKEGNGYVENVNYKIVTVEEIVKELINSERVARENDVKNLNDKITAEETERENAVTDLNNKISAEETARETEDSALQALIGAETSAREKADTLLAHRINVFEVLKNDLKIANVKDYGAKGDGSSDDTTFINLAINELNNGDKNVLFFPCGTYIVNSNLTTITTGNIRIAGEGAGLSIIRPMRTNAEAIIFTSKGDNAIYNIEVSDLSFVGSDNDNTLFNCFLFNKTHNLNVHNIYIDNVGIFSVMGATTGGEGIWTYYADIIGSVVHRFAEIRGGYHGVSFLNCQINSERTQLLYRLLALWIQCI